MTRTSGARPASVRRGLLGIALGLVMVASAACSGSADVTAGTSMRGDGATSSTTETSSTDGGASTGSLDWQPCDDEQATDASLRCTTLDVPLDYGDPSGETISLALVVVPATEERTGAILFNPGGPGGSGFDYIAQGGPTIVSELGLEHFDLIGFDPRGVDRSAGVRCLGDAEQDATAYLDDTPDTPEEQAALDAADGQLATACRAKYGDALQHYSTANTARDMDAIRAALGDEQLSYLGISYGTYLGAVYATMFPDHVRALVLDSAFEPTGDSVEQQYETQLLGFERAFDDWASWCEGDESCEFRSADVGAAWDALRQELDDSPIPNDDGRLGNQSVMGAATIAALYSRAEWPVLGAALHDADEGDPAGLFRLADAYAGRDEDGHYTTIDQSNTVITCASGLASPPPPDPAAYAEHLAEIAPRFGAGIDADSFDEQERCAEMMPPQPQDEIAYSGEAPIVVVGGTNDPATPLRWAEEMTADLGPSARLVTYTGDGHGQLLASTCVTDIEAAVLADLDVPDDGTVCEPDPEVEEPEWWQAIPDPTGIDTALDDPELLGALGLPPTQLFSEVHTTDLGADEALAAYRPGLEDAGFTYLTEQQPLPGASQAVYNAPNGDLFSIFVVEPEGFESPEFESAADLVPPGKTVVILLFFPS